MRILNVSQSNDTEAWLEARRGKITGTKSGPMALEPYAQIDVQHLLDMADKAEDSAGKARTEAKKTEYEEKAEAYRQKADAAEISNLRLKVPLDFWKYLAELWAQEPDGEPPMARGHRLENTNAQITLKKLGIPEQKAEFDTGLWVSDIDERIACSPDVHELPEGEDKVTWAIECKSLGTPYHLQAVVPYLIWRKLSEDKHCGKYEELEDIARRLMPNVLDAQTDFDFVPEQYKPQVIQYFVVNPRLQVLYFSMYDDRIYSGKLAHVCMTVKLYDVIDQVKAQRDGEEQSLRFADQLGDILEATF